MRLDRNIGAWKRGWASAGQQRASITDLVGRFDMSFVWHAENAAYVCALRGVLCESGSGCVLKERYNLIYWQSFKTNLALPRMRSPGAASVILSRVKSQIQSGGRSLGCTVSRFSSCLDVNKANFARLYSRAGLRMRRIVRWDVQSRCVLVFPRCISQRVHHFGFGWSRSGG